MTSWTDLTDGQRHDITAGWYATTHPIVSFDLLPENVQTAIYTVVQEFYELEIAIISGV